MLGVGAFGMVLDVINLKTKENNALKIIAYENTKGLFSIGPSIIEQDVMQAEFHHQNIIKFKTVLYS